MDLLMNGLLMAASLFAGGYCWVLGRRVQDLKSLDRGLGGSIVTLTRQIELARTTLDEARAASKDTRQDLAQLLAKADAAANQLKLLIAAAPVYPPAPAPAPAVAAAAASVPAKAPERLAPRPLALAEIPDLAGLMKMSEPTAPRAEEDTPAPAPAPAPSAAPNLAEVPKPRALAPVENPLRRSKGAKAAAGDGASETAILEALTALAAGGR